MSQEEKEIQAAKTESTETSDDHNSRKIINPVIERNILNERFNEIKSEILKTTDKPGLAGYSGGATFKTAKSKFPKKKTIRKKLLETISKPDKHSSMEEITVRALKLSKECKMIILMNLEQDINKERQLNLLKSDLMPEQNTSMENSDLLMEFMIEQAVERCLEKTVNEVVSEFEEGILSLIALKPINTKSSRRRGTCNETEQSTSKQQFSQAAKSSAFKKPKKLKHQASRIELLKAGRKDTDIFLSILEEIGRINDFYRRDILDKNKRIREIQQFTRHVNESLTILEEMPKAVIITIKNENGEPYAILNVYEFGLNLYTELASYLMSTKKLNEEYNEFRIKFHEMSEAFTTIPFETFVGTRTKNVISNALDLAKDIYKEYFEEVKFEFMYELLSMDLTKLQTDVKLFDMYLDQLGE